MNARLLPTVREEKTIYFTRAVKFLRRSNVSNSIIASLSESGIREVFSLKVISLLNCSHIKAGRSFAQKRGRTRTFSFSQRNKPDKVSETEAGASPASGCSRNLLSASFLSVTELQKSASLTPRPRLRQRTGRG